MSSWLKFNESLSSLKGQISTFANNVLAEEEGAQTTVPDEYEELKRICLQQEQEIQRLRSLKQDGGAYANNLENHNVSNEENSWDWETTDTNETKNSQEDISYLKNLIKDLQNEKNDLLNQLEQLDAENQQNVAELVKKKDQLQEENNEIKEKFITLKKQNVSLVKTEENLKQKLELLRTNLPVKDDNENCQTHPQSEIENKKYEALLKNHQNLQSELEHTKTELTVLKSTHVTLEKALNETRISYEKELNSVLDNLKKSEAEKKIIYNELQKAKEFVKISEIKSREDSENAEKLALILDTYEKQVSCLKQELQAAQENQKESKVYSKKIDSLEKTNRKLQEELETTLDLVKLLETENEKLKQDLTDVSHKGKLECEELKYLLDERTKEIRHLQEKLDRSSTEIVNSEIEELNNRIDLVMKDKEDLHKNYINILTENVKKYSDSNASYIPADIPNDPAILEFSKQVENIFNLLSDLKYKCELLEKQNLELSQEKTQILKDKNVEIEKLLQNSENLSQDVLRKTEEIKALEEEYEEQRLNNNELEDELRDYKNFKLDTISESNEDNVVLLESQLENANKKIKELENQLAIKNENTSNPLNIPKISVEDCDTHKLEDRLSPEEKQVEKTEHDYRELLRMFDDLKIDYELVQKELQNTKINLDLSDKENEELSSELEKLKTDFDNSLDNVEYQLTEANITMDTLREEINNSKSEIDKILEENKKLALLKNEIEKSIIDTKTELNDTREQLLYEENKRKELETQVRMLTEKLQNSKMTETSLKLQYDTLSREHSALVEAKNNMEMMFKNTKISIEEYERNYSELLEKYDIVLLKCEELNAAIMERDNTIFQKENEIKSHKEEAVELEKAIKEKEKLVSDWEMKYLELKKSFEDLEIINEDLKKLLEHSQTKTMTHDIRRSEDQRIIENESSNDEIAAEKLNEDPPEKLASEDEVSSLQTTLVEPHNAESSAIAPEKSRQAFEDLEKEKVELEFEVSSLKSALKLTNDNVVLLQNQVQEISKSRNELIAMITTKNQESLTYYNEIQRLTQILQAETEKCIKLESELAETNNSQEIEKLSDQNNFLKEKCDVLARNLLEEQGKYQKLFEEKSSPSEKEVNLNKQLERLQSHLMEVEEHYTQELLQAEQQNSELRTKMNELEQREKNSSTMYTSVSIRANQQVESLQSQLQMVTNQRDELRKKISDAEDQSSKQAAALSNLQFVLEQFQRDKEKDVFQETERIRRQINVEKKVQEDLKAEINNLKLQLEESKQGLLAASRLSDQLEFIKSQNLTLREEVTQLQEKLSKSETTIHQLTNQTDGKVDKTLVKSLVVGFLSSGNTSSWNKDQIQILKIIATVLDFNQQDHEKVRLNHPQGSWLGSLLFGPASGAQQNMSQESLSQAFIKFLESESKPRVVPSLLDSSNNVTEPQKSSTSAGATSTNPSRKNSRTSPIVLSEIVLPTFDDFGRTRNSSSILKDVLKDHSNS